MLQWAGRCPRLRQFILVSSTYVAGSNTGLIRESVPPLQPDFVTHYQRTKWEAEQLALSSGLPIALARISLIMGSHATGFIHRTGAMHSLIRWFARGLVPMLPGLPTSTADLIATETAARCLAKAARASAVCQVLSARSLPSSPIHHSSFITHHSPSIWHIAAGAHAPSLAELVDFVFEQFSAQPAWRRKGIAKPPIVDQMEFDRFVQSAGACAHPALGEALKSINSFMPDLLYPKTYDTTRAQAMWGGPLPLPDWRATLQKVIHFIARRRPSCQPENPPALADAS
jgi:nucleoside-diphosphate-sugar epimerase